LAYLFPTVKYCHLTPQKNNRAEKSVSKLRVSKIIGTAAETDLK
jgi:hypothetical protein